MNNIKKEKGAIIVEASIALPVFMFAIVTILTIVNMCYAQAKIQVAVNSTAKEMSQYFYLYGLTGLDDAQANFHQNTLDADANITEVLSGMTQFMNGVNSATGAASGILSDPSSAKANVNKVVEAYNTANAGVGEIESAISDIADDPQNFIMGVASIVAESGIEYLKSSLGAPVARMFCKKHLTTSNLNTEQLLKKVGVVPKGGSYYNGIDFSDSKFCVEGTSQIRIIAKYQLQVIKLFDYDIRLNFVQCGYTNAWFGGTSATSE